MADPKALARKFVDKFGPIFRHTNDETIREIALFLGEIVRLAVQGDSGWWRTDIPRPHKRADGIPTRSDVRWHSLAELAISRAMRAVEEAGGSPKLTEAVTLLSRARDCVADHVEGATADARAPTNAAPSQTIDMCPGDGKPCYVNSDPDEAHFRCGTFQCDRAANHAAPSPDLALRERGRAIADRLWVKAGDSQDSGYAADAQTIDDILAAISTARTEAPVPDEVLVPVELLQWAIPYLEEYDHTGTGSTPSKSELRRYEKTLNKFRALLGKAGE